MPPPKWQQEVVTSIQYYFPVAGAWLKMNLTILCTVHAIVSALMKREDYKRQGCTIQFNRINPSKNEHVGSFAECDLR